MHYLTLSAPVQLLSLLVRPTQGAEEDQSDQGNMGGGIGEQRQVRVRSFVWTALSG